MNLLNHIAIIMDGNGRWGIKKKRSRNYGHESGTKNILPIIKYCIKKKIKYLTLYAFSIDNWKRPDDETFFLFNLLKKFIKKNLEKFIKENVNIKFIGQRNKLKKDILKLIKIAENKTKKNNLIHIIIALNYSSKAEIKNSVQKIFTKKVKEKKISIKNIEENLYTQSFPDPQILIRTGGYKRLSDFLLWQLAYAELFFLKKLWPDFNTLDLELIIKKYNKIKRNFGSL